jgi:hypothetical protein
MATDPQKALDSWKDADANARAAENLLKQAWQAVDAGRMVSVPESLLKSVADLRSHANDKLTVALQVLGKRSG